MQTFPSLPDMGRSSLGITLLFSLLPIVAQAVDSPPTLTSFTIATPTVNSTQGDTVVIQAEIADAAPGVCTSACDDFGGATQVSILHPETGQRREGFFAFQQGDLYESAIPLSAESAPGLWVVESLWLADASGNRARLSTEALSGLGFDTEIQNDSTGGDVDAPEAGDVSPATTAPDVTFATSVEVSIELAGSENLCTAGCQVSGGPSQLRYQNVESGQIRDGVLVPGAQEFVATIDFPGDSAAGTWLATLRLVDTAGNVSTYDDAALQLLGFDTALTTTSSNEDAIPPEAGDSAFVPDPIDSTISEGLVVFAVDAIDPETGVCVDAPCGDFGTSSQVRFQRRNSTHSRFGLLSLMSGSLEDGTFDAAVAIPISGEAGVWRPTQLLLVDQVGNRILVPEPGGAGPAVAVLLAIAALVSWGSGRSPRAR